LTAFEALTAAPIETREGDLGGLIAGLGDGGTGDLFWALPFPFG
jgi:hypothetical protein